MKIQETNREEAHALALSALGWTLSDDARAQRLLALTGLTPEGLRGRLADQGLMAAVLRFLEAHEPDLLACAEALETSPVRIVAAREALER
jgi:predicted component of type VI protein secretion system